MAPPESIAINAFARTYLGPGASKASARGELLLELGGRERERDGEPIELGLRAVRKAGKQREVEARLACRDQIEEPVGGRLRFRWRRRGRYMDTHVTHPLSGKDLPLALSSSVDLLSISY